MDVDVSRCRGPGKEEAEAGPGNVFSLPFDHPRRLKVVGSLTHADFRLPTQPLAAALFWVRLQEVAQAFEDSRAFLSENLHGLVATAADGPHGDVDFRHGGRS